MIQLRTPDEVAARLRCSRTTLAAHVRAGDIRYVIIGSGKKRTRRMFKDADVEEFIERQTRKDVPPPPPISRGRSSLQSGGGFPSFTALLAAKLKGS